MKPKYDPGIHGDPPPLTDDFLQGMRPARKVHGDDWIDAKMGRSAEIGNAKGASVH